MLPGGRRSMAKQKKPVPSPMEVVRRRRANCMIAQEYISLAVKFAVLALVLAVLFTQVFLITQVSGNDMFPAVKDGDLVVAYRLQGSYAKDDVVVFNQGGQLRTGRIIGREGDVINMDESGNLQVNGTTQAGEILYPTYAREGSTYPYVVPEGCVYILCDYRTQCEDSRDFGPVRTSALEGKVITLLRRRGI